MKNSSAGQAACETLRRLQADHEAADALHARTGELVESWLGAGTLQLPQARELNECLGRLQELYADHIRVEEAEVFPLASKALSPEELTEVGQEMRARRGLSRK